MKWTQTHIYTLKEAPSDAEIISHKLLIRGGYIKKLAPGIFTYGPLMLKAIRKFENIIREELNSRGAIEISMPVVHPRELWEETNRWEEMGEGLLKFQNRNEHWFCLGATHEEAVTDFVRNDIKSYRDLPRNIYQIQTKYRDEIRPRFGLMRGREFIMKDAYSFDMDSAGALKTYDLMYQAYQSIFNRLGLNYRIVKADAGNIGGSQTHEFQLLADAGEDALLVSDTTQFAANIEVCPAIDSTTDDLDIAKAISEFGAEKKSEFGAEDISAIGAQTISREKFATPNQKTIADLSRFTGVPENKLVKTLFFDVNENSKTKGKIVKAVAVLLRGSDELNLVKLKNLLGLSNPPAMLTDEQVKEVSGASPGSCGPIGLTIPVYVDNGVIFLRNYIVGANEEGFHFKNVNHKIDFEPKQFADLRMARAGDRCPESKGKLMAFRGIEVGHVFYLGTKYSEKMKATFLDSQGKAKPFEMGCYGIGVTRTVQACIEQSHDGDGIIWPESLAPFSVHICLLDPQDSKSLELAISIESRFKNFGTDVLIDDRDERPGVKFKDADLLGMPLRVVIGKKGMDVGEIEVVNRKTKEIKKVNPNLFLDAIQSPSVSELFTKLDVPIVKK